MKFNFLMLFYSFRYDLIKEALVTKANSFSGRMEGEIFDMLRTGKGLFMTDMNNNFKYWHSFANQGLAATWESKHQIFCHVAIKP